MLEHKKGTARNRWVPAAIGMLVAVVIAYGTDASAQNVDWSSETNMVVVPNQGVKRDETGALSSRTALNNTLDGIGSGVDLSGATSNQAKITAIENSVGSTNQAGGIVGLGGVNSHLFMWAAAKAMAGGTDLDLNKPHEIRIFGKIRQYAFRPNANDPYEGNGILKVVTGIRYWPLDPNTGARDRSKREVLRFRYRIRVRNNAFKVIERDDSTPNDPFPESEIVFDEDMVERLNERGYRYKLHARGTDIKIQKVWIKENNGPWQLIPKSDTPNDPNNKYRSLYSEVAENCIDILFVEFPPTTKAGLGTTPAYCMGRCSTPMIVNTGM